MKLIYCMCSIYNPGGMERVLLNKVAYLDKHTDWELLVVTTDQKNRPPFYPFPKGVRMIDLGINYSDDNVLSPWQKIKGYLKKRRLHRQRLTDLLMREKADCVVSLYPSESSFLPSIKDGSKKILELHFCKFFRLQYGRKGVIGWIDRWRTKLDEKIVRNFDKFVVLTKEDMGYWGNLPNIVAIPNSALFNKGYRSNVTNLRVIAVGRLDYQKGFDRLLKAWSLIQQSGRYENWKLDIFGQGEWYDWLNRLIVEYGLENSAKINRPTNDINAEYAKSSLLVMTSNYEGFGMVLVEAMACGVPTVAFDCKCGPSDIIKNGENGLLVKNGDIKGLANAMMDIMGNIQYRRALSKNALLVVDKYSEEKVMKQWLSLFQSVIHKN